MKNVSHLESTIQAAGLVISAADLLDIGSPNYIKVPDEIRGSAYSILKSRGWTTDGIRGVIKSLMGVRHSNVLEDSMILTMEECEKVALPIAEVKQDN